MSNCPTVIKVHKYNHDQCKWHDMAIASHQTPGACITCGSSLQLQRLTLDAPLVLDLAVFGTTHSSSLCFPFLLFLILSLHPVRAWPEASKNLGPVGDLSDCEMRRCRWPRWCCGAMVAGARAPAHACAVLDISQSQEQNGGKRGVAPGCPLSSRSPIFVY